MVYSTYLAGIGADAIAVDSQGAAYLTGGGSLGLNPALKSTQFGLALPSNFNSPGTVVKLHPAGCAVLYSAILGGMSATFGTAIAVDASGEALVAGGTTSLDFPTVDAVQASCLDCNGPYATASPFISKLDPTGTTLIYSTFLGGSSNAANLCCNKALGIAIEFRRADTSSPGRPDPRTFPRLMPCNRHTVGRRMAL